MEYGQSSQETRKIFSQVRISWLVLRSACQNNLLMVVRNM